MILFVLKGAGKKKVSCDFFIYREGGFGVELVDGYQRVDELLV